MNDVHNLMAWSHRLCLSGACQYVDRIGKLINELGLCQLIGDKMVSVFITRLKGEQLAAMVDNGTRVMMQISVGTHYTYRFTNINRYYLFLYQIIDFSPVCLLSNETWRRWWHLKLKSSYRRISVMIWWWNSEWMNEYCIKV